MKVYHITNLHENALAESHKYKLKHILLEIEPLKLNLFKTKLVSLPFREYNIGASITLTIWVLSTLQMSSVSGHFSHWSFSFTFDGVF